MSGRPAGGLGMAEMPQPLMGGRHGFHIAPTVVLHDWAPRQHHLQYMQELFGNLKVALVAGLMEGHQDLVRQAPCVTLSAAFRGERPLPVVLVASDDRGRRAHPERLPLNLGCNHPWSRE